MKELFKKKWVLLAMVAMMLIGILTPMSTLAATTATITVTNTPQYIAITIDHTTWTVNGLTGNSHVLVSTTYYSNPLGDTVAPSTTVLDTECYFTLTNTANVATDITFNWSDMSAGSDNSTNGNTGTAGATSFGAYSYVSGVTIAGHVLCKSSASGIAIANLGATTNKKFGFSIAEQTNAWSGATGATSTITGTSVAH
jgi:hypothetical protein